MRFFSITITIAFMAFSTLTLAAETKKENKKKQTVTLYGQVYDSFTRGKVKAFVTLMDTDSTVVDTVTCWTYDQGTWSRYTLKVPREEKKYIIKTTAEGYEDTYTDYAITRLGRNNWIEMPEILMKRKQNDVYKDVDLEGVVVKGTRIQVAYKGDTIVYDASAFKLPEGSMLDGLIRQLPGAELKDNGDIYINGKKIDYLTLNGKDFFKGENKVMLENLPYFTVKDLKVFYKDTEKNTILGTQMEEKDYVMDVTLKREYARGYIANAETGAGSENRWMAKAFGLYYDDHTRVSLFGNVNNVNENRTPGGDGDWSPEKVSNGIKTTKQVGMNIATEDKKKYVNENLSARVTWDDTDNESKTFTETFADNGSIFSGNRHLSSNKSFNFTLNNSLYSQKLLIGAYTYISYHNNKSWSASADSTYSTTLTNRNEGLGMGRTKYFNASHSMWWGHKFEAGDLMQLNIYGTYSNNKPSESFNNSKTYYATTQTEEARNRYYDRQSNSYNFNAEGVYAFQFPGNWMVMGVAEYSQDYLSNHNDMFNLERLPEADYDDLGWLPSTHDDMMTAYDWENSRSYNIMKRSYKGAINIQRHTDKMSFRLTLPYNHYTERMNYQGNRLDTVARRTWNEFLPRISYRTFGKTKTPWELHYNTRMSRPSFADLMPLYDTSNPLSRTVSNPNLKSTITHTQYGNISFVNDSLGSNIYVGYSVAIIRDAVGNRTTYDPSTGAYTRMQDNVSGNWNSDLYAGWQRPLDEKKRFRMDLYGRVKYNRNVDFATQTSTTGAGGGAGVLESPISKVDNVNLEATAKFTYKLGDLSAGIIGKITSRHTRGQLDIVKSIDANDMQYGFNATYTIPVLKLTVATDMNLYSRRGYESSMMNTDELVWNAQLSRSFLKGALTAKLLAYDLLAQISSKRYDVNAQGRMETWYNYIPRYVMFSLAYKFTRKPKKG